tara:strand:- start:1703 stop:2008 length:306 start_codon:yes stop_codon:yes gene_type:complete
MSQTRKLRDEFGNMLEQAGVELGKEFEQSIKDIREYAAQRMMHLSMIIDEPGYLEALVAERDSIALFAGIKTVQIADAADAQLIGTIGGAIRIGALALAGA